MSAVIIDICEPRDGYDYTSWDDGYYPVCTGCGWEGSVHPNWEDAEEQGDEHVCVSRSGRNA